MADWLIVLLGIYSVLNITYVFAMIYDAIDGVGCCETPADFADLLGINLFGGSIIFILYLLLFPLYNILLWTFKLIYWLFHIGVK